MFKVQTSVVALLASVCVLVAVSATAEGKERRHHHHRHAHHRHHAFRHHHGMAHGSYVIGRTAYGDTIISGRTGMHRSDTGVMVPDTPGGDLDDAGRIGANGTVGVHVTGH